LSGLLNDGNIRITYAKGEPLAFAISGPLENRGTIIGANGVAAGEPGSGIEIRAGTILNDGLIRSGDGGPGGSGEGGVPANGGDGGIMAVFAQAILNNGQIIAGNGGNGFGPPPVDGGAGGNLLAGAGPPDPGYLLNTGLMRAGDGGNGGDGRDGGNGGNMAILSSSTLLIDGGTQQAGRAGKGIPPGQDGNGGSLALGAALIWENGELSRSGEPYAFRVIAPASRLGSAGSLLLVPLFFLNTGLNNDTYQLVWSNSDDWNLENLPASVNVNRLQSNGLMAAVVLPSDLQVGDDTRLRLTARSKGRPIIAYNVEVRIVVASGSGSGNLYLPLIVR
jgi:hypothetical protein